MSWLQDGCAKPPRRCPARRWRLFSAAQGRRKRYGMAKALHLCGLPLVGAHHRALDDGKNIAQLLSRIVGEAGIRSLIFALAIPPASYPPGAPPFR